MKIPKQKSNVTVSVVSWPTAFIFIILKISPCAAVLCPHVREIRRGGCEKLFFFSLSFFSTTCTHCFKVKSISSIRKLSFSSYSDDKCCKIQEILFFLLLILKLFFFIYFSTCLKLKNLFLTHITWPSVWHLKKNMA